MRASPSRIASREGIWVAPNRNLWGLAAVLLAMWYAGASQSNGAAYLLCFVLTGVTLVSTLHTWANLCGVAVTADPIRPVFVGEELSVRLHARSDGNRAHFAIKARADHSTRSAEFETVPSAGDVTAELRCRPQQRGIFPTLVVRIASRYPLGFLTASRLISLVQPYVIYPEPAGTRPLPVSLAAARHSREGQRVEGDEFGGVRSWRRGESQRHIDWKAAARGQPLLVKQWCGDADETLHFEWQMLGGLETEARLSQLARWIVLAERRSANYSIELPGAKLPPARGEAHYHACLRALAAFHEP